MRILVTGASIAGPAAAYWLSRVGYDVTVLEAAPELRPGGQNIDVRGTGREVLRRMGLEEAVLARNTGEVGTRFVDEDGGAVGEFGVGDSESGDGPTAEVEVLRGALAQVIVDACSDEVDWRWGDRVVKVDQAGDGVEVSFESGAHERYDLLVAAEGVGSHTRGLVFGDEPEVTELGMYAAYATIERTPADDDWWRALIAPGSRQASLRPDDEGTIRANLNFLADSPVLADLDDAGVRAAIRERYDGVGWEVPRILDGFDAADDLYVDWLRQIRLPAWHRGDVCLLGDAAWCVTPIGGGGASVGLIGAYVLAAYLSQADGTPEGRREALAAYDAWMRPVVTKVQDLPPGVPRIAAPRSAAGVKVFQGVMKLASSKPIQALFGGISVGPSSEEELPELVEAAAR